MLIISHQCILSVRKINGASSRCYRAIWNHIGPHFSAPWYSVHFASFFFSLSLAPSVLWVSCTAWMWSCTLPVKEFSGMDGAGGVPDWVGLCPREAQPELLVCGLLGEPSPSTRATAWLWVGRVTQAPWIVYCGGREGGCAFQRCVFQLLLACLVSPILTCLNRIRLCCALSDRTKRKVSKWSALFQQIL